MQITMKVWEGTVTAAEKDAGGNVVTANLAVNGTPITADDANTIVISGGGSAFRVLIQNTGAGDGVSISAACDRGSYVLNPAARQVAGSSVVLESVGDATVRAA